MKHKWVLPVAATVAGIAILCMIFALTLGGNKAQGFIPPAFEAAAQSGTPSVTDDSWSKIYQDGMSFSAHVCGRINAQGGCANVYFANDDGNNVWLKLRILDEAGNILGETGLLKPNEYVKSVQLNPIPANGTKIKLKIMAYEPETFYSAGAVALNTTIGG